MTIRLTAIPRIVAFIVGWWLIASGVEQLSARSKGADSWRAETSFMALQLRAQGTTNIGLGWLAIGSSLIGIKIGADPSEERESSEDEIQKLIALAKATEPKSKEQKPDIPPFNLPIS